MARVESLKADLEEAIGHAQELGVRTHGRFDDYLVVLRRVEGAPFTTDDAEVGEALHQTAQLLMSRPVWRDIGDDSIVKHLQTVFGGGYYPGDEQKNDKPRDFLFELVAASHLAQRGFKVRLRQVHPDIYARDPVRGQAVRTECKRPSNGGRALERALRKGREQLRVRKLPGPGVIALAVERICGRVGFLGEVRSLDESTSLLNSKLREVAQLVTARLERSAPAVAPEACGVLLSLEGVVGLIGSNALLLESGILFMDAGGDRRTQRDCQRLNVSLRRKTAPLGLASCR